MAQTMTGVVWATCFVFDHCIGGSGYALMVSVDWMGVIEGVVVELFAVMGGTIYFYYKT